MCIPGHFRIQNNTEELALFDTLNLLIIIIDKEYGSGRYFWRGGEQIIKLDFSMFKSSLFDFSHSENLPSSLPSDKNISFRDFPVTNRLLSSANSIYTILVGTQHMSIIYNINRRGYRIDPLGTPIHYQK